MNTIAMIPHEAGPVQSAEASGASEHNARLLLQSPLRVAMAREHGDLQDEEQQPTRPPAGEAPGRHPRQADDPRVRDGEEREEQTNRCENSDSQRKHVSKRSQDRYDGR